MKKTTTVRKVLSLLLSLAMIVSTLAGLSLTASAAVLTGTYTGYTSASQVDYVTVSGTVANWGARGEAATFLTTYAQNYYTGSYSYATLSALSGSSSTDTSFYSSALGTAIHNMLVAKQTSTTSYNGTRDLYKYTDCVNSNYSYISSFYSGTQLNGEWDSGSTWNREHTWPNSKGLSGSDENDIMMLRPTSVSENSSRGNKAYGSGSSYYDPNSEASSGLPDLHGDVARLMLQHLMRWGNTSAFYGTSGVMESRAVLLQWMEEDPVDTWEMGRNDAVQSITGVRNVFVDYPELAFKLLGASVPSGYSTPSSGSGSSSSYTVTATSNNTSYGTVSVSGTVITASPKTGYYASGYTVTSGTATVTQNGNTFTVTPSSNCTVRINFAAKTSVTVSFSVPAGVSQSSMSGYAGEAITLPTPSGTPTDTSHDYTFLGWVTTSYDNVTTQPTILSAGSSYTPTGNVTLYALYRYTVGGTGSSSDYTKISSVSDITDGASYVITSATTGYAMSQTVSSNWVKVGGTYSGTTITPSSTDVWTINSGVISCSDGSLYSTGAKNISLSSSNSTTWAFTVSGGEFTIKSGSNELSYNANNGNGGWRPYSGGYGSDKTFYIYKAGSGGTNYYTTVLTSTSCTHTYTSVVTAPTCTTAGYTTYTCTKCGDTYTGNQTAALGHNYQSVVTAPTCTASGYTTYTCSRCGDSYTGSTTAALGHSYGAFRSNNNGTHSKTCSRCSDVVTESCTYTSSTSGATTTFTCTVCSYSYQTTRPTYTVTYNDRGSTTAVSCIDGNSVTLPATASTVEGYTFVGWVEAAIPTETATQPTVLTGSYTPTASVTLFACYTRTESGSTSTAAEIGNSGSTSNTYQYGSPYNFYYKNTMNEMLYTAAEVGAAGTITDIAFYVASRSKTLSPTSVKIYMTTTSNSTISTSSPYYASNLTLVYSGSPTMGSATGWENLTLDTPFAYNGTDNLVIVTTQSIANYDSTLKYQVSSASGKMIYRQNDNTSGYADASNSSYSFSSASTRPVVKLTINAATTYYTTAPVAICSHASTTLTGYAAPTCTTAGYSGDYVCDDCGETVTAGAAISALGHDMITDAAVAATCTESGLTAGSHCSRCDYTVAQEVVPALGHNYQSVVNAPTCTESGFTAYTCSVCGDSYTGDTVPALGHDYIYTDSGNGTTHTVSCSRCDYNATENHAFVNGTCVCGAVEAVETLKLVSAAPVLNDKIDMIYAAEVPTSYSNPYVVFTFNGSQTTVRDYTTDAYGRLLFVFTDINPQCMGDEISATLYATKNGTQESVSVTNYSVRDYCVNKLADNTISASLRTLLSDLLAYGAAAQTYMNYKTNALVTDGNDINNPNYTTFSALSGNAASFTGEADSDVYWTAASLTLTSSVAMNFRFYAESTDNLSVTVSVNGRSQTFTEFTAIGGGVYGISFTGIQADELAQPVTASFARSGAAIGNTLTYSVNAYVQSKQNDSNAALQALVRALYNYGASAAVYATPEEA